MFDQLQGPTVAQEVERVVHIPQGWWFNRILHHYACQSAIGQDTEPQSGLDV